MKMKTMNLPKCLAPSLAAVLVAAALVLHSGCFALAVGAAGGAGAVAYVRGELDTSLPKSLEAVDAAANRAITQLQFAKVSENKDALKAEIIARTGLDKKVTICLDRSGDALTRVRVRVGLIGDETISRATLDKIRANL